MAQTEGLTPRDHLYQRAAPVRFEWGRTGAAILGQGAACLVVVDVLSFTTAVSIAVGRGMAVLPYRAADPGAEEYASAHHARLAVRRRDVSDERPWSLSPAALVDAPFTPRLVLPSPNGSAIAAVAEGAVLAGCLRNAAATARWLVDRGYGTSRRPLLVVAAGERWPDGSLRPALEDALAAGAILGHLRDAGRVLSAEAAAVAAMHSATTDVAIAVRTCASSIELLAIGFDADVDVAVELDQDDHIALLRDGAFVRASAPR